MTALVVQANSRCLPLPDSSVDLVVTSPPYFALRSYTDGGEHYAGQVGDEPTPQEFLDSLIAVTAECMRVLKHSGSLWVNLGDSYADKSLRGTPWRYALRCIDDLGLILRAEVIWSKPNGLPESVTDRVRRSHEQWFHFTLSPRYFSAVDEVREPQETVVTASGAVRYRRPGEGVNASRVKSQTSANRYDGTGMLGEAKSPPNALGKLPGSVWTVPTQPLKVPAHIGVDHFAAFPMEFPRRIVQGWSPAGICVECGDGRRPVADRQDEHIDRVLAAVRAQERVDATGGTVTGGTARSTLGNTVSRTITGYACACPEPTAPTRPAVVLDPFGGTGTTALVASMLGRTGISVDLSHDYSRLAQWRTTDPRERAAAMQVEKPEPVMPGQADLFGGAA